MPTMTLHRATNFYSYVDELEDRVENDGYALAGQQPTGFFYGNSTYYPPSDAPGYYELNGFFVAGAGLSYVAGLPIAGTVTNITVGEVVLSGSPWTSEAAARGQPGAEISISGLNLPVATLAGMLNGDFAEEFSDYIKQQQWTINGSDGGDDFFGGIAADDLNGGGGNDSINGDAGDDIIDGGEGNDFLQGDDGRDYITGGAGDDQIYGGAKGDFLFGNRGDDYISPGAGADQVDGGQGIDWVVYLESPGGVSVDLTNGIGARNDAAGDIYVGVEVVQGSYFADNIVGSATGDRLFGMGGDDIIYGKGGNDEIGGSDGKDQLYGGAGHDILYGGGGNDRLFGNTGLDMLDGGAGNDQLTGGADADYFVFETDGATGFGGDIVYDFQNGLDRLDMRGVYLTSNPGHAPIGFADLTIGAWGDGVKIVVQNGQIVYLDHAATGITVADIDAGDFLFA